MRVRILAACVVIFCADAASAQTPAQIASCRTILDSLQRLRCYDELATASSPSPSVPAGQFQRIEINDLKVDRNSMIGQSIEVSGKMMSLGDMLMLSAGDMDTSPIMVDSKEVSREQRRRIVDRCNARGCNATVQGKVATVMFQTGIAASSIVVR